MSTLDMELFRSLSEANGVSGHEDEVVKLISSYVSENLSALKCFADPMMNLFLTQRQKITEICEADTPRIMFDAHSDEVGLMVQSIDERGLINFVAIGGWIPSTLPAQRFRILNKHGDYINGVIASKAPHFMSEAERNVALKLEQLKVDIGASSREETINDYGICIGMPIIPISDFKYNPKTGLARGKAFDNRVGCFCVVELMKRLGDGRVLPVEPVGAIATQEEIGLRGAKITAARVKPKLAVLFEGTPADDTHVPKNEAQGVLGKGVQIRFRDGTYLVNHRLMNAVMHLAEKNAIPYQTTVRAGGGTNAGAIHLSNEGIPTIVLGIPCRYIHTHNSYLQYADILATVNLAELIVMNYPEIIGALQVL